HKLGLLPSATKIIEYFYSLLSLMIHFYPSIRVCASSGCGMWVLTEILHHSKEQAFRPVPQKINFLVEQAGKPVDRGLIDLAARAQF
uniref:hypothetical protein n=1 Tax=Microcoleus sp. CAWBG58 TaxID=2841651 RepID=UPI0025D6347A